MNDVKVSMNQYFRGQSLVAFCVGILFCIGFLIIDFPLAIPLGLFIGLLNMVPYLQIVGFIPTIRRYRRKFLVDFLHGATGIRHRTDDSGRFPGT